MNLAKRFKVRPGRRIRLSEFDADDTAGISKGKAEKMLAQNLDHIFKLQYNLFAEHKRALLIVLQGLDAAGKDGVIRRVMSGLNPQGCRVTSFKVPSREELDHDFLWRIHKAVPCLGEIGIFNRSHYEDVLVVRVHGLAPESVWSARYGQINEFEKILAGNGVTVVKFFLHISKGEQKKRLTERLEDPAKNWKFTPADAEERKCWDDYTGAYEDVLARCSTKLAPWYVIPSDHKWFRNLAVSAIVLQCLEKMDPRIPEPSPGLAGIRIR